MRYAKENKIVTAQPVAKLTIVLDIFTLQLGLQPDAPNLVVIAASLAHQKDLILCQGIPLLM